MPTKHIVIVGSGFGGITAAIKLERTLRSFPEFEIILIDQNPYQLYVPALYEIAAVPKEIAPATELKSAIIIPISDIIGKRRIKFIQGKVTGLNKKIRCIALEDGTTISYHYVILAAGSETNYFGIPGLKEHAYPLKRFEDAIRIRNKFETILQEKRGITIVVGGAGASGVELIAEFANFACTVQKKIIPDHPVCDIRLILIEGSSEILSGFNPAIIAYAKKRLRYLNIEIQTEKFISKVDYNVIQFKNGPPLAYDLCIWTGGVMAQSLFTEFGLPLGPKKNFAVNEFLEIEPSIFAIGDAAGFIDKKTGKPVVWTVPAAETEASIVAQNIIREIRGKIKKPFQPLSRYPFVLALGKKCAVADLLVFRIPGIMGWIIKLLVELRYLLFILPIAKALRHWMRSVKLYTSNDY